MWRLAGLWAVAPSRCRGSCGLVVALQQTPCDLALVDLRLPDLNGIDLLREVRARGFRIPVVIVTADAAVDSAVEAMKLGAADYVSKAPDPDHVTAVVRRVLAGVRHTGETMVVASGLVRWAEAVSRASVTNLTCP